MENQEPACATQTTTDATESATGAMSVGYEQPDDPPSYYEATDAKHYDHVTLGQLPSHTGATYPSPEFNAQSALVDETAYQPVVSQQPYNIVLVHPPDDQTHVTSGESVCQLIWAIFNCLCCFWPIGIVAIVFASMAVEASRLGDSTKTRHYTRVALWLNVTSLILGVVMLGVFLGLLFANN